MIDGIGTEVTTAILQALGVPVLRAVTAALDIQDREVVGKAILDIRIEDGLVFPVAERLEAMDIPFVFASGGHGYLVPARFSQRPFINKPYRVADLKVQLGWRGIPHARR